MFNDDNFDGLFTFWMVISLLLGVALTAALIWLIVEVAQYIGRH